ncbi:unnamed protein product [Amoebophrya sp. A25]|nr:unnamed protein product [Amoebophrya sp. A25]|eukprot:GSA25T00018009001.1
MDAEDRTERCKAGGLVASPPPPPPKSGLLTRLLDQRKSVSWARSVASDFYQLATGTAGQGIPAMKEKDLLHNLIVLFFDAADDATVLADNDVVMAVKGILEKMEEASAREERHEGNATSSRSAGGATTAATVDALVQALIGASMVKVTDKKDEGQEQDLGIDSDAQQRVEDEDDADADAVGGEGKGRRRQSLNERTAAGGGVDKKVVTTTARSQKEKDLARDYFFLFVKEFTTIVANEVAVLATRTSSTCANDVEDAEEANAKRKSSTTTTTNKASTKAMKKRKTKSTSGGEDARATTRGEDQDGGDHDDEQGIGERRKHDDDEHHKENYSKILPLVHLLNSYGNVLQLLAEKSPSPVWRRQAYLGLRAIVEGSIFFPRPPFDNESSGLLQKSGSSSSSSTSTSCLTSSGASWSVLWTNFFPFYTEHASKDIFLKINLDALSCAETLLVENARRVGKLQQGKKLHADMDLLGNALGMLAVVEEGTTPATASTKMGVMKRKRSTTTTLKRTRHGPEDDENIKLERDQQLLTSDQLNRLLGIVLQSLVDCKNSENRFQALQFLRRVGDGEYDETRKNTTASRSTRSSCAPTASTTISTSVTLRSLLGLSSCHKVYEEFVEYFTNAAIWKGDKIHHPRKVQNLQNGKKPAGAEKEINEKNKKSKSPEVDAHACASSNNKDISQSQESSTSTSKVPMKIKKKMGRRSSTGIAATRQEQDDKNESLKNEAVEGQGKRHERAGEEDSHEVAVPRPSFGLLRLLLSVVYNRCFDMGTLTACSSSSNPLLPLSTSAPHIMNQIEYQQHQQIRVTAIQVIAALSCKVSGVDVFEAGDKEPLCRLVFGECPFLAAAAAQLLWQQIRDLHLDDVGEILGQEFVTKNGSEQDVESLNMQLLNLILFVEAYVGKAVDHLLDEARTSRTCPTTTTTTTASILRLVERLVSGFVDAVPIAFSQCVSLKQLLLFLRPAATSAAALLRARIALRIVRVAAQRDPKSSILGGSVLEIMSVSQSKNNKDQHAGLGDADGAKAIDGDKDVVNNNKGLQPQQEELLHFLQGFGTFLTTFDQAGIEDGKQDLFRLLARVIVMCSDEKFMPSFVSSTSLSLTPANNAPGPSGSSCSTTRTTSSMSLLSALQSAVEGPTLAGVFSGAVEKAEASSMNKKNTFFAAAHVATVFGSLLQRLGALAKNSAGGTKNDTDTHDEIVSNITRSFLTCLNREYQAVSAAVGAETRARSSLITPSISSTTASNNNKCNFDKLAALSAVPGIHFQFDSSAFPTSLQVWQHQRSPTDAVCALLVLFNFYANNVVTPVGGGEKGDFSSIGTSTSTSVLGAFAGTTHAVAEQNGANMNKNLIAFACADTASTKAAVSRTELLRLCTHFLCVDGSSTTPSPTAVLKYTCVALLLLLEGRMDGGAVLDPELLEGAKMFVASRLRKAVRGARRHKRLCEDVEDDIEDQQLAVEQDVETKKEGKKPQPMSDDEVFDFMSCGEEEEAKKIDDGSKKTDGKKKEQPKHDNDASRNRKPVHVPEDFELESQLLIANYYGSWSSCGEGMQEHWKRSGSKNRAAQKKKKNKLSSGNNCSGNPGLALMHGTHFTGHHTAGAQAHQDANPIPVYYSNAVGCIFDLLNEDDFSTSSTEKNYIDNHESEIPMLSAIFFLASERLDKPLGQAVFQAVLQATGAASLVPFPWVAAALKFLTSRAKKAQKVAEFLGFTFEVLRAEFQRVVGKIRKEQLLHLNNPAPSKSSSSSDDINNKMTTRANPCPQPLDCDARYATLFAQLRKLPALWLKNYGIQPPKQDYPDFYRAVRREVMSLSSQDHREVLFQEHDSHLGGVYLGALDAYITRLREAERRRIFQAADEKCGLISHEVKRMFKTQVGVLQRGDENSGMIFDGMLTLNEQGDLFDNAGVQGRKGTSDADHEMSSCKKMPTESEIRGLVLSQDVDINAVLDENNEHLQSSQREATFGAGLFLSRCLSSGGRGAGGGGAARRSSRGVDGDENKGQGEGDHMFDISGILAAEDGNGETDHAGQDLQENKNKSQTRTKMNLSTPLGPPQFGGAGSSSNVKILSSTSNKMNTSNTSTSSAFNKSSGNRLGDATESSIRSSGKKKEKKSSTTPTFSTPAPPTTSAFLNYTSTPGGNTTGKSQHQQSGLLETIKEESNHASSSSAEKNTKSKKPRTGTAGSSSTSKNDSKMKAALAANLADSSKDERMKKEEAAKSTKKTTNKRKVVFEDLEDDLLADDDVDDVAPQPPRKIEKKSTSKNKNANPKNASCSASVVIKSKSGNTSKKEASSSTSSSSVAVINPSSSSTASEREEKESALPLAEAEDTQNIGQNATSSNVKKARKVATQTRKIVINSPHKVGAGGAFTYAEEVAIQVIEEQEEVHHQHDQEQGSSTSSKKKNDEDDPVPIRVDKKTVTTKSKTKQQHLKPVSSAIKMKRRASAEQDGAQFKRISAPKSMYDKVKKKGSKK